MLRKFTSILGGGQPSNNYTARVGSRLESAEKRTVIQTTIYKERKEADARSPLTKEGVRAVTAPAENIQRFETAMDRGVPNADNLEAIERNCRGFDYPRVTLKGDLWTFWRTTESDRNRCYRATPRPETSRR